MNILEIIVIVLTLMLVANGYRKGFVRILASLASLIVSVLLVSVCLPYVTDFLKNNTPVYDFIVKQCRGVVEDQIAGILDSGSATGTALDAYRDMSREEIKALMEQEGYDPSVIDSLTDEQLEAYRDQYIQQYAARYLSGDETLDDRTDSFSETELIEHFPLPRVFKDQLLDNNNDAGYERLGVTTFQDYVVHFSANVILNVVSFVVALLFVRIVLHMAVAALDILSHIPVLGGLNRAAGMLLGLLEALILLWVFFMIVSAASTTEGGLYLMSMIQESQFLGYLYDSNFFMRIVLRTVAMFV